MDSRLESFLSLPDVTDLTYEVTLPRLGTFTITPMTISQHREYSDRCKGKITAKGTSFNQGKFNNLVVVNHVVSPQIANFEFLQAAGCATPEEFIERKFLSGEASELSQQICARSGFNADGNLDEEVEEAKN